jgi:hypothetical protein
MRTMWFVEVKHALDKRWGLTLLWGWTQATAQAHIDKMPPPYRPRTRYRVVKYVPAPKQKRRAHIGMPISEAPHGS